MNNNAPLSSPFPGGAPGCGARPDGTGAADTSTAGAAAAAPGPRLRTSAQLREQGITAATAAARSRPAGPWQQLLPGVYLVHRGPATGEDRLRAALLYAGRAVPAQRARGRADIDRADIDRADIGGADIGGADTGRADIGGADTGRAGAGRSAAMVTGIAALAARGFASAPPLLSLETLDVLVPRTRRLRSTGFARLIRTAALPAPELVDGIALVPVARALADAVAGLPDAASVRRLLAEAVRDGHCEPGAVVRELAAARLLARPHVVGAVDALLAEGRARAEDRLYALVRAGALPEPLWNVDLRLPGGPHLGSVDAFWPEHALAVELDTRAPRFCGSFGHDPHGEAAARWEAGAAQREHLEHLGVTVVHLTPRKLREAPDQQAVVLRTALAAAGDRGPAAHLVVLPR